jgi:gas vesicle protein
MHRDESRHDFAFIAGVIVGAIAGALATLAVTPMSGPETRAKLRERTGDLAPVKERASTVAESAQQFVAAGRERATELAAKSPLPIPGRHTDDERAVADADSGQEADTMTAEHPSAATNGDSDATSGSQAAPVHPTEPAEGRVDVPGETAGGGEQSPEETGSGRTPHPTEPAEGRADVPPATEKPDSSSGNGNGNDKGNG